MILKHADDGEEALRIIKENNRMLCWDIVIMPKLDGIGVLERLQTEDLSKRPIIIMSPQWGRKMSAKRYGIRSILFYFKVALI